MISQQEQWLEELKKLNKLFQDETEKDLLEILHKLINDSLCVEDIQDIAERHGIDNLMDKYYHCVTIFNEWESEDD